MCRRSRSIATLALASFKSSWHSFPCNQASLLRNPRIACFLTALLEFLSNQFGDRRCVHSLDFLGVDGRPRDERERDDNPGKSCQRGQSSNVPAMPTGTTGTLPAIPGRQSPVSAVQAHRLRFGSPREKARRFRRCAIAAAFPSFLRLPFPARWIGNAPTEAINLPSPVRTRSIAHGS